MNTLILPHQHDLIAAADALEHDHVGAERMNRNVPRRLAAAAAAAPAASVGANCDRTYHAVHSSGLRPLDQITLMVLHDEEATTALSAALWFENPASGGSATLCIDDVHCYRTMADNEIPWGAPGANYHGLHFEQAGYASWKRDTWTLQHHATIDRCAFKVAYHIHKYRGNGCRVAFLDHTALAAGQLHGITTHAECTKAFTGTHVDPGPGYPIDVFMARCEAFYAAMTVKHRPRFPR